MQKKNRNYNYKNGNENKAKKNSKKRILDSFPVNNIP